MESKYVYFCVSGQVNSVLNYWLHTKERSIEYSKFPLG